MEAIQEIIRGLLNKIDELAVANKELRDENERLKRQIEEYFKADADATATVAKK